MPNYYNTGGYAPVVGSAYFNPYTQPQFSYPAPVSYGMQPNTYWISVDGEIAARAWQMPANLPPNTIIPLWDLDGQHVYFKSTDAYGRINPLRKGRVVFDDDVSNLPNGQNMPGESMAPASNPAPVNSNQYVTKEDLDGLRHEIQDLVRNAQGQAQQVIQDTVNQPQTNQNGNYNSKNRR